MKKTVSLLFIILMLPFLMASTRYNYSYYGEATYSAPGMTYVTYADAQSLGILLQSPEDLVVFNDQIYLVDSSTNSLVIIDRDLKLVNELTTFTLSSEYVSKLEANGEDGIIEETLNSPQGIDVKDTGIYITDTKNFRIVKLNHNFEVVDIFNEVNDPTFDEINFEPLKITVDSAERMYVVAKNVYEGIIELNYDGSFNRFTGVNPLKLTPFEIFSRSLMTEEQLSQLQLFLPTEYTNVSINEANFIYATSKVSKNNADNPIQLINPKGIDVIKRNGYNPPIGDVSYVTTKNNHVIEGPSNLVDIAWTKDGIYTALDQKRSRLFTYDSEGNLLYINGDKGSQSDKFSEGTAVAYLGDDLLVLDRRTQTIIVYRLTEFGSYVNQAIAYHNDGEYEKAAYVWEKVINLNSNYEIAYNGIGKLLLRQERYKEAMENFKLGHDRDYYSKAYKGYRNEILKENFGLIAGTIVFITISYIGYRIYSTYKKGGSILYED